MSGTISSSACSNGEKTSMKTGTSSSPGVAHLAEEPGRVVGAARVGPAPVRVGAVVVVLEVQHADVVAQLGEPRDERGVLAVERPVQGVADVDHEPQRHGAAGGVGDQALRLVDRRRDLARERRRLDQERLEPRPPGVICEAAEAVDDLGVERRPPVGRSCVGHAQRADRPADRAGAQLRGHVDGAPPPLVGDVAGRRVRVQEPVVRVAREADLDAVDRDPTAAGRLAHPLGHRRALALGPPRVDQVHRELDARHAELVGDDPRPLLRLGPPLDREAEVQADVHGTLIPGSCAARACRPAPGRSARGA